MAGHVNQVPGAENERHQTLRAGDRAFEVWRSFHCMNVEVVRTRVISRL
jgi:hypothetical protein